MEKLCASLVHGERRVIGGARIAGRETNGMWRLKAQSSNLKSQILDLKMSDLRRVADPLNRPCKFSIASIASCAAACGLLKEFMTERRSSGQWTVSGEQSSKIVGGVVDK